MRKIVLFIVIFFYLSFNAFAFNVGDEIDDFDVTTLNDEVISYYSDVKGKRPLCIIFWASW